MACEITRKKTFWEDVEEDQEFPPVAIDLTVTRLVMLANVTRDFYPVHHDGDYARRNNAPDMFVNTYSYAGFLDRCTHEWLGYTAKLKKLAYSMQTMNHPGDTMMARGKVHRKGIDEEGNHWVELGISISNQRGPTTHGSAVLVVSTRTQRCCLAQEGHPGVE